MALKIRSPLHESSEPKTILPCNVIESSAERVSARRKSKHAAWQPSPSVSVFGLRFLINTQLQLGGIPGPCSNRFNGFSPSPGSRLPLDRALLVVFWNLTNMIDAVGTTKYSYDAAGQLLGEDDPCR